MDRRVQGGRLPIPYGTATANSAREKPAPLPTTDTASMPEKMNRLHPRTGHVDTQRTPGPKQRWDRHGIAATANSLVPVPELRFCRWWLIPQQTPGREFKVHSIQKQLRSRGNIRQPRLRELLLRGDYIDQILDAILVGIKRRRVRLVGGFQQRHRRFVLSQGRPESNVSSPHFPRSPVVYGRELIGRFSPLGFRDRHVVLTRSPVKDPPLHRDSGGPSGLARLTKLTVIDRGPDRCLRDRPREKNLWFVLCFGCANFLFRRPDSQGLRHEIRAVAHGPVDQRF